MTSLPSVRLNPMSSGLIPSAQQANLGDFFNGESFAGKPGLNPNDEFHGVVSVGILAVEFAPILTFWLRHPQL